jgi:hypothetical protein
MTVTSTNTSQAASPRVLGSPRVVEMLGNRLELLVEQHDFPRASVVQYTSHRASPRRRSCTTTSPTTS